MVGAGGWFRGQGGEGERNRVRNCIYIYLVVNPECRVPECVVATLSVWGGAYLGEKKVSRGSYGHTQWLIRPHPVAHKAMPSILSLASSREFNDSPHF